MADINKKWVAKQKTGAESSFGAQAGVCPMPSGPLQATQRAANEPGETLAKKDAHVRHNGIVLPFQPKRKLKLEEQFKHFLNTVCKVHINISLVESL